MGIPVVLARLRLSAREGGRRGARRVRFLGTALGGVLVCVALNFAPVQAHDPSAWGGLYRSRDDGANWSVASEGRYITAVLHVAVNPTDPAQMLLATYSGLLRSVNGGRDWDEPGAGVLRGLVLAVAFAPDAHRAFASTADGLFASDDAGQTWGAVATPTGAVPISAIVISPPGDRVYLVGGQGLFRGEARGAGWTDVGSGLPEGPLRALLIQPATGAQERLYALAAGQLYTCVDPAFGWRPMGAGVPSGPLDAIAAERGTGRLHLASEGWLYRSDDGGATWQRTPGSLDPRDTRIRRIAIADDERTITLTTDRGIFHSLDAGASWENVTYNLPIHLEAAPLAVDPTDPRTLYVGFSITPYDALLASAATGGRKLGQLNAVNLAGSAAFLALLVGASMFALRRLAVYYRAPATSPLDACPSGTHHTRRGHAPAMPVRPSGSRS